MSNQNDSSNLFGEVIYAYTRAQAIADGVLVEVSQTAREAGFRVPVALTRAAWEDCVALSEEDSRRQLHQDESGRLWDVLWMAMNAIRRRSSDASQTLFQLYRVPRDGKCQGPLLIALKLVVGPGDAGEPVITIMQPQED